LKVIGILKFVTQEMVKAKIEKAKEENK